MSKKVKEFAEALIGSNTVDTAIAKVADLVGEKVTDEVYKSRLAICNDCEFLKNKQCTQCGCNVATKAMYANMNFLGKVKCPEGNW